MQLSRQYFAKFSCIVLLGTTLLNTSCALQNRFARKSTDSKDRAVAKSSPRRSLFGKKNYQPVDPFLQSVASVENETPPENPITNSPPTQTVLAGNTNAQPPVSQQKTPYSLVSGQDKLPNGQGGNSIPPQSTAQTMENPFSNYENSTSNKPVNEISVGKVGLGQNTSTKTKSTFTETHVNPFATTNTNEPWNPSTDINDPLAKTNSDWPGLENFTPPVNNPSPQQMADEYLFDGGDRKQKFSQNQLGEQGLNSEDTVASYTDSTGKVQIKESNRVGIYAPKFGAVSSISDPVVHENIDKVLAAHEQLKIAGLENKMNSIIGEKNTQTGIGIADNGPSGIEHLTETVSVAQKKITDRHTKFQNVGQSRLNFNPEQSKQTSVPTTALKILAAQLFTRSQNPIIVASGSEASEIYTWFNEQEYVGTEERKKPGNLKISKMADRIQALPGDTITFTIEFENTGDLPISNVRVIDNLTPRLQFIEGSATCNLEGNLDIADNGEGSLILRWVMAKPMAGKTKGVVSFKARVE